MKKHIENLHKWEKFSTMRIVDQCLPLTEKCLECENSNCEYWLLAREEQNENENNTSGTKCIEFNSFEQ